MLTGGCLCGDIRFEARGTPFHMTNCHCGMCRRAAGAAFVTWFSVKPDEFHVVSGKPAVYRSSATVERGFCGRCGTTLTFRRLDLAEIDVTTASLDQPELLPPLDNVRTATRLAWIVMDGLPDIPDKRTNP